VFHSFSQTDVADRIVEDGGLTEVHRFGSNPGHLRMFAYVPDDLPRPAPLVVALHGCTQTAASYDLGTGWSRLARDSGFAVLFPEQQRTNNPKTCFNWFRPADTARDQGEVLSIRQMVDHLVETGVAAPTRIFITGLSAGGAMAMAMLAAYPDLFEAGAVIAGLPVGAAANVPDALRAMREGATSRGQPWADHVRAASAHEGPWPRLSVWQGAADRVVSPRNAEAIVDQWTALHGLPGEPHRIDRAARHRREQWLDRKGGVAVERIGIAGLGHGVPLLSDRREGGGGRVGPFFLDGGIASTQHAAAFFGLPVKPAADPWLDHAEDQRPGLLARVFRLMRGLAWT
jgi:feruloyl esterase